VQGQALVEEQHLERQVYKQGAHAVEEDPWALEKLEEESP